MSAIFELSYEGSDAAEGAIDFYDVSQALLGFQRSLALTVHAVINDEVITQAPSLKGARIIVMPPEIGSWKIKAAVFIGAGHLLLQANSIPKETPLGNMIYSAYDYVVSESLGFHVDYKKTLGQQAEELKRTRPDATIPSQSRLDGVIEKTQVAIRDMHRPIVKSETAAIAVINRAGSRGLRPLLSAPLDADTFDYINFTQQSDEFEEIRGRVSSYNINTFSGRIYDLAEHRTISFDLSHSIRHRRASRLIAASMSENIEFGNESNDILQMTVYRRTSRTGRTKSFHVLQIKRTNLSIA